MVSEPLSLFFRFGSMGELIRYRLIGFLMSSCVLPSYIVTDQKALSGGNWFFADPFGLSANFQKRL